MLTDNDLIIGRSVCIAERMSALIVCSAHVGETEIKQSIMRTTMHCLFQINTHFFVIFDE